MDKLKNKLIDLINNNNLFAPMLVLSFAIVVFGFLIKSGVVSIASKDESISVTGTTEKIVTSDKAKLTISISERAYGGNASQEANRAMLVSVDKVKKYLLSKGVSENEISTQGNNLSQICEIGPQGYENCSIGVKGQTAMTSVLVETGNVDLAKSIGDKIGGDLSVNMTNVNTEYFYSKLAADRVAMLSDAVKNARERALAVGEAGGARIGNILSMSSGVFQVTAENSVDVDGYGAYDTSAIKKKITATVKVNFSVR